mgnify:CR=1 FL=1
MKKYILVITLVLFSTIYSFADSVFVNSTHYANSDSVHFIILDIKNSSARPVQKIAVLVEAVDKDNTVVFSSVRNLTETILPNNHIGIRVPVSSDLSDSIYAISARVIDYTTLYSSTSQYSFLFSSLSVFSKTDSFVNLCTNMKNTNAVSFEYCIATLYIYDKNNTLLYIDYFFTDTLIKDENKYIQFAIPVSVFDAMSYYEVVGYSDANKK